MKCNRIMDDYIMSDATNGIPLRVRFHMMFCNSCKEEINKMSKSIKSMEGVFPFKMEIDLTDKIMEKVEELELYYKKSISSFKWITAGTMIFSSIFLIQYSDSFSWLKSQFGGDFEVPVNIAFGLIVSVYALAFTTSHLDGFKKVSQSFVKKINH